MLDLQMLGWVIAGVLAVVVVRLSRRKPQSTAKDSAIVPVDSAPAESRIWLVGSLTKREMQIVRMVLEGKRSATIAKELDLSVHTVESHIQRIYAKLEVHNRLELVRKIREIAE